MGSKKTDSGNKTETEGIPWDDLTRKGRDKDNTSRQVLDQPASSYYPNPYPAKPGEELKNPGKPGFFQSPNDPNERRNASSPSNFKSNNAGFDFRKFTTKK